MIYLVIQSKFSEQNVTDTPYFFSIQNLEEENMQNTFEIGLTRMHTSSTFFQYSFLKVPQNMC